MSRELKCHNARVNHSLKLNCQNKQKCLKTNKSNRWQLAIVLLRISGRVAHWSHVYWSDDCF